MMKSGRKIKKIRMEEVVNWSQFWDHLNLGNVNHVLDLLPSILIKKNGTLKFDDGLRLDILSTICYGCKTDEIDRKSVV